MHATLTWPLVLYRALRWKAYRGGWLQRYLRRPRPPRLDPPIDIVVAVVDHFEPPRRHGPARAAELVRDWCASYTTLADGFRDADGRPPQHTWFYRSEYRNDDCLAALAETMRGGLGEVEFHLHHGHDDHHTFLAKLRSGLEWFRGHGMMLGAEPEPASRFAYIAGNWALDNGAGNDAWSGCNTELAALREAGCYADFTFPALGSRAQPRRTNSVYYATDTPAPKSYDDGVPLRVGGRVTGDLLLVQGPSVVDWRRARFDDGGLENAHQPSAARLDAWRRAHVHVEGRPEWILVKLHTHGMQSRTTILGSSMREMWEAMLARWNTPPYRLHFVTAREMVNIVKAAEAGHSGNPGDFRDWLIPPPAARLVTADAPWSLRRFDGRSLAIERHADGPGEARFAGLSLAAVRGSFRRIRLSLDGRTVRGGEADGPGLLTLTAADGRTVSCEAERLTHALRTIEASGP